MKKSLLICLILFSLHTVKAQGTWTVGANNFAVDVVPNFGTKSNHVVNFLTNNSTKMVLGTDGTLKINNLAGTGNRFLRADANGFLVPWVGSGGDADKILFGNNTWKTFPFSMTGNDLGTVSGTKLGIGVGSPATALDVSGDATISGYVKAPDGFKFSISEGITFNPLDNTVLFGNPANLPTSSMPCLSMLPSTQGWVMALDKGVMCTQWAPVAAPFVKASIHMYVNPGTGNGHLEVSGKDNNNSQNNGLYLNQFCARNTYINWGVDGGSVFIGSNNVLSKVYMGSFVNMTNHLEIGDPLAAISDPNNIALDINADAGKGILFHTTTAGLRAIAVEHTSNNIVKQAFTVHGDGYTEINSENSDAFAVKNYNQTNNLSFKIQSDGKTDIQTTNADALNIINDLGSGTGPTVFNIKGAGRTTIGTDVQQQNANMLTVGQPVKANIALSLTDNGVTPNVPFFKVYGDGRTAIGSGIQNSSNMLTIGQPVKNNLALSLTDNGVTPNISFFNVYGDGLTEIKSTNTKALSIKNAYSGNETFMVQNDGYAEIKVYYPASMPIVHGTTPRAFTVRDMSNNRDLFTVRADGKAYAREIEISLQSNFPDYVFAKEYKLRSIAEVADYINKNNHLPGFEKGEYYEKNGINVNDMLIKQQEKIEELTLYIIQLEKRMSSIEKTK